MTTRKYGHYTKDNVPTLSSEGDAYFSERKQRAEARKRSPSAIATRIRAEKALEKGGFRGRADFIGIMLGAKGYEDK